MGKRILWIKRKLLGSYLSSSEELASVYPTLSFGAYLKDSAGWTVKWSAWKMIWISTKIQGLNESGYAYNYYTPSETFNPSMLMLKWGEIDKDFWASCISTRRLLSNSRALSCSSRNSLLKNRGFLQLLGTIKIAH